MLYDEAQVPPARPGSGAGFFLQSRASGRRARVGRNEIHPMGDAHTAGSQPFPEGVEFVELGGVPKPRVVDSKVGPRRLQVVRQKLRSALAGHEGAAEFLWNAAPGPLLGIAFQSKEFATGFGPGGVDAFEDESGGNAGLGIGFDGDPGSEGAG